MKSSHAQGWGLLKWQSVVAMLCVTTLLSSIAVSQVSPGSSNPMTTVEQFKKSLDAGNVTSMCGFMAESDSSGPLVRLHFEKMQQSMSELIKLWQYTSFAYGGTQINTDAAPPIATVHVSAAQLKQEVTFSLLRFDTGWYICDIQIYFK
jgi:hypothetical protein